MRQDEVKYLWVKEAKDNPALVAYLRELMQKHDGKVPYKSFRNSIIGKFKFNPTVRVSDSVLEKMFYARDEDYFELYPVVNGIVHEKTEIYRPSLVN